MSELIIIGDSHTIALGQGHQAVRAAGLPTPEVKAAKLFSCPVSLEPFHLANETQVRLTHDGAAKELTRLIGRDHFLASDRERIFALSLGFTNQVLLSKDDWNSFAHWSDAEARGKMRLSDGVIREIVVDHFKHVLRFTADMRALGLRCVAIASPPLLPEDHWVAKDMSPVSCLAVDALARKVMTEEFLKIGVPSVAPPPQSYRDASGAGYRDPIYKGPGVSGGHGTEAYGRLMFERVLDATTALAGAQPAT